jgi:hypothetical protein
LHHHRALLLPCFELVMQGDSSSVNNAKGVTCLDKFNCCACLCQVLVSNCILRNKTAELGGGLHGTATSVVNITSSKLAANVGSKHGGAVYADGNATVQLSACSITNNSAQAGAGAFASEDANLTVAGSVVAGNNASVSAGGLGADAKARLFVNSSFDEKNAAAVYGGGLAVTEQASVPLLHNSSVQLNAAKWGGGFTIGAGQTKDLHAMLRYIVQNIGVYSPDLSPAASQLSIIGSSRVSGFVSQLGSDQSVLPIRLNVSGPFGLPCDGQLVQALLNGTQVLGDLTAAVWC